MHHGHHKFIFVCGLHRSGTSVFFRCLASHPLVGGINKDGVFRYEGQHLQTVYQSDKAHGGPGKFGFHPEAHLTEDSPLVSEANRRRLLGDWQPYWDVRKPFLLEKSPPNLLKTRFLQAMFPESYFIMVIRHPIATSMATQKWSHTSVRSLLQHWLVCHERFEADRAHLRRAFVVRYEAFVLEPKTVLDQVAQFLGLEPEFSTAEVRSEANEKYWAMWDALRRRHWVSRWHLRAVARYFEQKVNRFGYSFAGSNEQTNEHTKGG